MEMTIGGVDYEWNRGFPGVLKEFFCVIFDLCIIFSTGVMNPHSTGIGGGGFMLIYMKKKDEATVIDFRESAPKNSDENLFKGNPENGIKGSYAIVQTHLVSLKKQCGGVYFDYITPLQLTSTIFS